jgi:homoserine dehydrogenase
MKLRQIARIARTEGRIVAAVAFEPVEPGSFFGALEREWNGLAVRYASDQVIALRGRGAGRWPTTEAVMADIFDAIRAHACGINPPYCAVSDQRLHSAGHFVTP